MPSPLEGASGAAEKVAPLVKVPVLMRIVVPGFIAVLWLYPLVGLRNSLFSISFAEEWRRLVVLVGMTFILGGATSVLRGTTYKLYEGRAFWPLWLFTRLRMHQQSRVAKLLAESEKSRSNQVRYDEIWYKLRAYPSDSKGNPFASHPTLLGNILAAYEDYPWTRYGMDSVFFWPRIWMQLEKEKKDEIDANWSPADGFLSASAVAYCGGLAWLLTAAFGTKELTLLHLALPFASRYLTAISSVGFLVLGFCLYRLSLGFHRGNGETFKSLFDLYRDRLTGMSEIGLKERSKWTKVWAYLQYFEVPCEGCGELIPGNVEYCAKCDRAKAT
jgi:hypothetical protein